MGAGMLGRALPLARPLCPRLAVPSSQAVAAFHVGRPWTVAGEQASHMLGCTMCRGATVSLRGSEEPN